ncbi:MAG: methylated-DNA--[protein]-cysteine S-methyltransferase [Christensenellales bacterium]
MRHVFETPLGSMTAIEKGGALTALSFGGTPEKNEAPTPLLAETERQLAEYFSGERRVFSLPLAPEGTAFQRRVWAALLEIPYGETLSYGEVARRVGNPKAARAVGMANNRNPIAIVIPCHRVVGADGSLTGYAGGLAAKERLLALEHAQRKM